MGRLTATVSPACGFEPPPQLLDVFLGLGLCFTPDRFLALPETGPFKVSTGKRTQGSPTAEAVKGKLKELYWSYTPVYSELHVSAMEPLVGSPRSSEHLDIRSKSLSVF